MVCVGGHALETEEKSGTKGYYVGFASPKIYEIAASAYRIALLFYALYKRPYRLFIKVYIGERGEKPIGEQLCYLTRMLAILFADLRETDQAADKNIL